MLGFYIYPIPNGIEYTATHLQKPEKVVELFNYCSILEGIITQEGWGFLISFYGYEKLFQLDKQSSWFDVDTIEEYIECVQFEKNNS